jgi:hypothetical protein
MIRLYLHAGSGEVVGSGQEIYLAGGLRMKNIIYVLVGLSVLFLLPGLVSAECVDFSQYAGKYVIEGNNLVVLYDGNGPIGRIAIQCDIQNPSLLEVQLPKPNVCDGDEILVDGKTCFVIKVTPMN